MLTCRSRAASLAKSRNQFSPIYNPYNNLEGIYNAEAFKAEYDSEQLPRFIEEANSQGDY